MSIEIRSVSPATTLADLSGRYVQAQEERQRITNQMREIVETHEAAVAKGGPKNFTSEHKAQLDKLREARSKIEAQVKAERYEDRIAALTAVIDTDTADAPSPGSNRRARPDGVGQTRTDSGTVAIRTRGARHDATTYRFAAGTRENVRCSAEYLAEFREMLRHPDDRRETRAHVVAQGDRGGFLAPMVLSARLIEDLADEVFMRQLATLETVTGASSLGVVAAGYYTDASAASENVAENADTADNIFGMRELTPHGFRKVIDVSRRLIRQSARDPEVIVGDRLRETIAGTEEGHFMVGTGANQPLGVFTASADGIPTSRDTATGAANGVGYGGVLDSFYGIKQGYRINATWIMHRDVLSLLHQLTDANGNALVRPDPLGVSTGLGTLDRILGRPVVESEYAPNTLTDTNYAWVFGDFRRGYMIATSLDTEITIDPYSRADRGVIRYTAEHYVDGQPVLPQAFSRGVIGA